MLSLRNEKRDDIIGIHYTNTATEYTMKVLQRKIAKMGLS